MLCLKKNVYIICLVPALMMIDTGCRKSNAGSNTGITPPPIVIDTTTLKNVAPFKIGAAIDVSLLQNDGAYRSLLLVQHNSITDFLPCGMCANTRVAGLARQFRNSRGAITTCESQWPTRRAALPRRSASWTTRRVPRAG